MIQNNLHKIKNQGKLREKSCSQCQVWENTVCSHIWVPVITNRKLALIILSMLILEFVLTSHLLLLLHNYVESPDRKSKTKDIFMFTFNSQSKTILMLDNNNSYHYQ